MVSEMFNEIVEVFRDGCVLARKVMVKVVTRHQSCPSHPQSEHACELELVTVPWSDGEEIGDSE